MRSLAEKDKKEIEDHTTRRIQSVTENRRLNGELTTMLGKYEEQAEELEKWNSEAASANAEATRLSQQLESSDRATSGAESSSGKDELFKLGSKIMELEKQHKEKQRLPKWSNQTNN